MTDKTNLKQLYRWVPSVYALEALPYTFVTMVALIIYKNFNFSNATITFFTSLFTLPWLIKPIFSPIIENQASKRTFMLTIPFLIAGLIITLALSLFAENFFHTSIGICFLIALFASVYDLNTDGFYITHLNANEQAHFIGIRTLSYQAGRLIVQGFLVFIASLLTSILGIRVGWQITLSLFAVILLLFAIYHLSSLPKDTSTQIKKTNRSNLFHQFTQVYREMATLPNLLQAILFVFIFNFAENQLTKIFPLFLMDSDHHSGLALGLSSVALLNGGIGITGMLLGILLSGFILERVSLTKVLIPVTIFIGITNIGYLFLSVFLIHNLLVISLIVILTQFSFGLSNGLYMLYLLRYFGRGAHSMSLYAIGTALMNLAQFMGGATSGYIQHLLGYSGFFIWILMINASVVFFSYTLSIPGIQSK